jgi:hypothetical protein
MFDRKEVVFCRKNTTTNLLVVSCHASVVIIITIANKKILVRCEHELPKPTSYFSGKFNLNFISLLLGLIQWKLLNVITDNVISCFL